MTFGTTLINIYTKFLRNAEEEDGDKDGNNRFEKMSCRWKEGRTWEECEEEEVQEDRQALLLDDAVREGE